ncbi:hypothetical protein NEOLEDRAFT_1181918 [Neolentinus lepideus HHB14362 ss-1]|uniref:DUF6534 domain-containing protein n=1 Tax=Neolentinus lepideus HHB14362 ss-1 TaxID=1314782 RepID=A0A165PK85_9AGAM|nr:hypothetical protein NEOLEDRAFT_1181918 [Neolentinus lepideus HHB14362 ss-1]
MSATRAPADIVSFVGPAIVGLAGNCLLLGALMVQVYIYSINFPNDPKRFKFLVYFMTALECVQSGLILNDAFGWAVYGWGIPNAISSLETNWLDVPVMSGFIAIVVQLFFAWRIWVLGRSYIWSGIIAAGAILEGSGAIASGIMVKIGYKLTEVHAMHRVAMVWYVSLIHLVLLDYETLGCFRLVTTTIVDVLIAASMTYLLLTQGSGTNRRTQLAIRGLARLSIETGSVTAALAIVNLVLYQVLPGTGYFLAPADLQAKMYTNTLLVIFNNRTVMREQMGTSVNTGTVPTDPMVFNVTKIVDTTVTTDSELHVSTSQEFRTTAGRAGHGENTIQLQKLVTEESLTSDALP